MKHKPPTHIILPFLVVTFKKLNEINVTSIINLTHCITSGIIYHFTCN